MKLTKSLLIVTLACGTAWSQTPANNNAATSGKTPSAGAPKTTAPAKAGAKPAPSATKPVANTAAATKAAPAATKPVAGAKPAAVATKPAPTSAKSAAPAAKPVTPPKPMVTAKKPVPAAKPKVAQQKPPVAKPVVKAAPMAAKKTPKSEGEVKPASVKEETKATRVGKMRDPFVSPVVRSTGTIGPACDTGKRCLVVDQIVLKGIVKSPSGFIAVVENPAKRAYFMRENDPVFNGKITKITGDTVVFQEQTMDKLGKQTMREVVKKVNAPIV